MFLFQRIEEVMMTYHDARHAVGEFVLAEQANLYRYTITEIAEYTYTSKATVVRFAKTLGFDGWKEFMKAFISELKYQETHQGDVDVNYPFKESDSTEMIIQQMLKLQIESIKDTADLMEVAMIEKASEMLLKAKHVVVFGMSPNIYLGELFRRKCMTIGKQIEIVRFDEAGITSRTLGKEDCAIIISYSGNNPQTNPVMHLKTLQEQFVPVIGITSGGDNYLRAHLDCVLTISSKERLYTKISNFASEESIAFILNVLFAAYFSKNYQENCFFKIQNSKMFEQERTATLKNMQDV